MTNFELIEILKQLPEDREVFLDFTKPGAKLLTLFPVNVVQLAEIEMEDVEEVIIFSCEPEGVDFSAN